MADTRYNHWADEIYGIAQEANEKMVNTFKQCLESNASTQELHEVINEMDNYFIVSIDRHETLQRVWEKAFYSMCNNPNGRDPAEFISLALKGFNHINIKNWILQQSIHDYEWKAVRFLIRNKGTNKHPFDKLNYVIKDSEMTNRFNVITHNDLNELVGIFGRRVEVWRPGTEIKGYPPFA